MEPIGSPETSVSNYLTLRNDPEDGVIQFNRTEHLRSRMYFVTSCAPPAPTSYELGPQPGLESGIPCQITHTRHLARLLKSGVSPFEV